MYNIVPIMRDCDMKCTFISVLGRIYVRNGPMWSCQKQLCEAQLSRRASPVQWSSTQLVLAGFTIDLANSLQQKCNNILTPVAVLIGCQVMQHIPLSVIFRVDICASCD
ncbi:hypothetical protein BDV37DRAFT_252997 [Aspergillus pseudonomiae]|uniref:Uncharacterized protein n=1 Tax=Aspergillus pseudonomiae TaxID=1506151 RepID=A0A5N7D6Y7_9EURO|nr:uncharacterized protein BDV37DRAFT_252997 [Aspergillus pseudonomiae]KAE8402171.1 hypothetical protein BDV37DRAFT_252997 [Aspergillus pseudonomiae]